MKNGVKNGEELASVLERFRAVNPPGDPRLAPHQQSGAARVLALLRSFGGAILADLTGTGKSWTAAAVAKRLAERGFAIELLVPAALIPQWKDVLSRFELPEAALLSHESIHRRDARIPIPGEERFLVVDEAHRFRNPATQRYDALQRRSIGCRLLLMTATPLCNRLGDLHALVRLLVSDSLLAAIGIPSIDEAFASADRAAVRTIFELLAVRRGRESLEGAVALPGLARETVRIPIAADAARLLRMVDGLELPMLRNETDRILVRRFLRRRFDSSPAAFRDSVRRQARFYRRVLEMTLRGAGGNRRRFRDVFGSGAAELFQDLLFPELWFGEAGEQDLDVDALRRDLRILDRLSTLEDETKITRLQEILLTSGPDPVLVYTGSVATAAELFERLRGGRRSGIVTSHRSALGALRVRDPAAVFTALQRGELDLLILTDLGAEGLNLQRAALVVHYDLPWNPMRLEQRNGRICRIGQSRPRVRAVYFIPDDFRSSPEFGAIARKERLRSVMGRKGDVALREPAEPPLRGSFAADSNRRVALVACDLGDGVRAVGLFRDGMIDFSVPAVAASLDDLRMKREPFSPLAAEADCLEIGVRTHLALPPWLPPGAPQQMLARRCRGARGGRPLLPLLAMRHRAGVEALIREMASEIIDRDRLTWLREIMVWEQSISPPRADLRILVVIWL
ncbi:MAG: helicase-related protein [Thermoanaerobaculia bacterium]